ncbi:polysaccharide deacetylase family protein [Alkalibacillus aidingensis]|uniref:polysaccharide deacetylase family protein n=1 Tax=Alkalibacillus aidingensis TaxID=2747607 RepID=UPI00166087FE|nr:polysaccharide deacetylase family protein [Alkalibacillus aidingensis]
MKFNLRFTVIIALITMAACTEVNEDRTFSSKQHDHFHSPIAKHSITLDEIHQQILHEINPTHYPATSQEWGEFVTGVKTQLDTDEQVIALTFDACGGPYGREVDDQLVDYLIEHDIAATFFINKDWIEHNESLFLELTDNPLFQIENHGTEHLPLSIEGQSAWGIEGTQSRNEVIKEVVTNHQYIDQLTGQEPTLFRSGTAHYDEVAVQMVQDMGLEAVNYDVLGDAGGTFSKDQVVHSLLQAKPGSIALLHMNQPTSDTAEGVIEAIPELLDDGFEFVQLQDYELR